jgi:hypothetical protein
MQAYSQKVKVLTSITYACFRANLAQGYTVRVQCTVHLSAADCSLSCCCAGVAAANVAGTLGKNQDDARQRICNWIDGTQRRSTAFDFVTKGVLQVGSMNYDCTSRPQSSCTSARKYLS